MSGTGEEATPPNVISESGAGVEEAVVETERVAIESEVELAAMSLELEEGAAIESEVEAVVVASSEEVATESEEEVVVVALVLESVVVALALESEKEVVVVALALESEEEVVVTEVEATTEAEVVTESEAEVVMESGAATESEVEVVVVAMLVESGMVVVEEVAMGPRAGVELTEVNVVAVAVVSVTEVELAEAVVVSEDEEARGFGKTREGTGEAGVCEKRGGVRTRVFCLNFVKRACRRRCSELNWDGSGSCRYRYRRKCLVVRFSFLRRLVDGVGGALPSSVMCTVMPAGTARELVVVTVLLCAALISLAPESVFSLSLISLLSWVLLSSCLLSSSDPASVGATAG